MAAILIGSCTVTLVSPMAGMDFWTVVAPSTADADDTIDVSTIVDTIYDVTNTSASDGLVQSTATTAGVVDLKGSTANEARTVYIWGKKA